MAFCELEVAGLIIDGAENGDNDGYGDDGHEKIKI